MLGGLIGGGLSLVGGLLGGRSQERAAQTSADAQLRAAEIAAEAARFRPVGVTTRFGQSQFTIDPNTGDLVSAGYTTSPELQAIQNRLLSQAGAYSPEQLGMMAQPLGTAAQSLFGLGQGYLAQSPEEARQRYISQQQALLAPQQEQALAGIRNRLFQTGRTGLATGGTTTGMAQTNPELAAYYNALAQQQAQLAAGAEQAAQQQTAFGAGLFGSGAQMLGQIPAITSAGYGPLSTQLGLAGTIEGLGQQALDIGSALGGRVTAGSAAAGSLLGQGMTNAARTLQASQGVSPFGSTLQGLANNQQFTSGVANWFNNLIAPTPYSGRGTIFSNNPAGYTEFDY